MDRLRPLVTARRMIRTFTDEVVPTALVDELVDLARRAPSAGNTQSSAFLVLEGDDTGRYWDVAMPDAERRRRFRWQGLLRAPVLIVPYVRPAAYVARYAEDDKRHTGLGDSEASWTVPYWWVDGGAVVEHLLLGATDAGLGACLFGQFGREPDIRRAFGVPEDRRALGTVALGWPSPTDEPGRSASRPRPPLGEVIHRRRW